MSVKIKRDYSYVGKSLDRNDSYQRQPAVLNTRRPEIPQYALRQAIRSNVAHAIIKNIDTSEAEKLPGVKAIITAKDVPAMKFGLSPPALTKTFSVLTG